MSELLAAAEQGAVVPGAAPPQLVVISNEVGLLAEERNPRSLVSRPRNLDREERLTPYDFNGASIRPLVGEIRPPDDEAYAKQFFDMLEIKEDFESRDKDIVFENMISRVLFQCLLSGILGFVYNTYISEFSIYNKKIQDDIINKLAFEVLQSQICTDEQMSEVAKPGTIGKKCLMPEDLKGKADLVDLIITSLTKENTLNPEFKNFLGVDPPGRIEDFGQHYETLLEMVMRLGTPSASQAPESGNMRLRILKNVCKKIAALLKSIDIITLNSSRAYVFFKPIVSAASDVASDSTTLAGRIKSLVILAAAYNSYGWLFAIIAPFAIPAGISVATGTVKGIGKIAMLPIKLIQRLGAGFGKKTKKQRDNRDPINKLICIGYTTKNLPGDAGILKIPYYISLNDILDLSYELQSWEFAKRSLLSTMTIGHGVFDLGDWQDDGLTMEKQRLLSATNPLVTLFGYIADEFTQITTIEYHKDDDETHPAAAAADPYPAHATHDYEYIDVISQQMFNVIANTIKDDNLRDFSQTEMMKTTVGVWLGFFHDTASDIRSAIITSIKTMIDSGPFENDSENSISSGSTINSSIDDDSKTIVINITSQSPQKISHINSSTSNVSDLTVSPSQSRTASINLDDLPSESRTESIDLGALPTASSGMTLTVNLGAVEEVEKVAVSEAEVSEAEDVKLLFSPGFISNGLNSEVRSDELSELIVAEAKGRVRAESSGGYRRKHSNMMSRDAAKMQNKLVSQHRTVNNQKVMQYMPEHDLNQRKFVKGRKSKNYRNKKQKTKKRNKKQLKKRQTKKVLRKRRTTKKRYAMNKN